MDNNQNNNFNGNQDPNQNTGFGNTNGGYTDPNQNWQQPQYQTPPQYTQPYPPYPAQETEPPMSIGQWILTLLVLMIPCVNLIMLFVWGFGGDPQRKSRANYCKAQLILIAASIVLSFILVIICGSLITALINTFINAIMGSGAF